MSELYKRLEQLCAERGITGYRMCKDCQLSPSTMTDLKSGRKKTINANSAERIATYFGVSVSYLLGTEKEKPATIGDGLTEKQEQIIQLVSKLSDQEASFVLSQLKGILSDR